MNGYDLYNKIKADLAEFRKEHGQDPACIHLTTEQHQSFTALFPNRELVFQGIKLIKSDRYELQK